MIKPLKLGDSQSAVFLPIDRTIVLTSSDSKDVFIELSESDFAALVKYINNETNFVSDGRKWKLL